MVRRYLCEYSLRNCHPTKTQSKNIKKIFGQVDFGVTLSENDISLLELEQGITYNIHEKRYSEP